MICAVRVDSVAAIQTNTWEAMQRLVDALTSAITQAKHAEEALALAGLAS
jgi:flagellar biosynthesis chaperone FliJ